MAVSETIQEILQGIDDAQYGRDMRQYIHKGIQKCYEEGSAGETDLEARERLDILEAEVGGIGNWYNVGGALNPYNVAGIDTNNSSLFVQVNPVMKMAYVYFSLIVTGTTDSGRMLIGKLPLPRDSTIATIVNGNYTDIKAIEIKLDDSDADGYPDGCIYFMQLQPSGGGNTTYTGGFYYIYTELDVDHPITY